jgi:hypothetical protein
MIKRFMNMPDRTFEYMLNAMEYAGQQDDPSAHSYAAKRRAVFAYVANLEQRVAMIDEITDKLHSVCKCRVNMLGGPG